MPDELKLSPLMQAPGAASGEKTRETFASLKKRWRTWELAQEAGIETIEDAADDLERLERPLREALRAAREAIEDWTLHGDGLVPLHLDEISKAINAATALLGEL